MHVVCDLSGGGAERLVLELCRRASSDIEAQVVAVQPGGILTDAFRRAAVAVRCAGRRPGRLGLGAEARLIRWCREVDVVHTHLFAGDTWGRTAALVAGTPLVSTEHNIDRDEGRLKQGIKAATGRGCDAVIAVSPAVAAYWRARGVAQVRVIPNGVDLTRFGADWQPTPGRILAIGRLMPQKGFDLLLEATRELSCSVQLVGEGPQLDALAASALPHQQLLGRREDIPALLARAALAVVPSRWEGFGLVALEAMAAGTPLVVSDVDGLSELVGDAALTVGAEDPQALRSAISRVLGDPALAARLSRAGRRRAARFSIEAMVADYETLYRELMAA